MGTQYIPIESKEHPGWYEIPGYQGYCANRLGQLLTKKTGNFSNGGNAGRYLKVSAYPDGADKAKLLYLHELICLAFYGPRPEGMVVLHKNNDRWDCRADNLMWGTQSDNIKQVYKDGLRLAREAFEEPASFLLW